MRALQRAADYGFRRPGRLRRGKGVFGEPGDSLSLIHISQTVTLTRGAELVKLQIGNLILRKDGVDIPLDVAPFLESDRTMVPVRAISEAFQATVDWNGHDQSVWIQLD